MASQELKIASNLKMEFEFKWKVVVLLFQVRVPAVPFLDVYVSFDLFTSLIVRFKLL